MPTSDRIRGPRSAEPVELKRWLDEVVLPWMITHEEIEQLSVRAYATAHGYSVGDVLYIDSASATGFSKALADDVDTLGRLMVVNASNPNEFIAVLSGLVTVTSHGFGAKGTPLYLSEAAAGDATTTAPSLPNEYVQKLGEVWDSNTILFMPEPGVRL